VFSLRGWSPRIQTECPPPYLGSTDGRGDGFRLRGCYPLWRPFPRPSTTHVLCNSLEEVQLPLSGPATPRQQRLHAVTLPRFRLAPVRSPLLRGSRLLSLPPGTEMFQFPGLPLPVLCVQTGVTRHDPRRVSPFGHPRINAWLAAPRGLSQPPTSFVGFWRLGIHRVPFVTWQLQRCSRSLCSSQGSRLEVLCPPCRTRRPVRIQAEPRGEVLAPRRRRSLKAQQCARPGRSRSRRSAPLAGRYWASRRRPDRIASDRHLERPGREVLASWRPSRRGPRRCSLERR
jgi:hypothetical protein